MRRLTSITLGFWLALAGPALADLTLADLSKDRGPLWRCSNTYNGSKTSKEILSTCYSAYLYYDERARAATQAQSEDDGCAALLYAVVTASYLLDEYEALGAVTSAQTTAGLHIMQAIDADCPHEPNIRRLANNVRHKWLDRGWLK